MIRKAIVLYLIITIILPPLTAGAVTIPGFYGQVKSPLRAVGATQLPVLKSPNEKVKDGEYVIDDTTTANKMTINQQKDKIVIDWKEFDIGKDAWVHFDQKGNTNWAALNRIWDTSPSQIYGRLSADGKIYLINQNGILFGPGAQVNVHTLIASSLNLRESDFMNNLSKFNTNQEEVNNEVFYSTSKTPGTVTNLGTITTIDEGSVFLVGPNVENGGTIESNLGQIGLIAGYELELTEPLSADGKSPIKYADSGETRRPLVVKMTKSPDGAAAWNMEGGFLGADQGLVGMYGGIVNQDGLIRSVTAVQRAGHVELMASQKIVTGSKSWIATPVSASSEKISDVDAYDSTIIFSGIDSTNPADPETYPDTIEHRGRIDAPQGYVALRAKDRVYLESGSTIDVSGLWIDKSASDQVLTASMTSVNLRDAFMQKNSVLKGQTITMGALTGSAIGDVSGSYSEGLTAAERHTQGGRVVVGLVADRNAASGGIATGDFVMREGAMIDISGGGFRYAAGTASTTVLVSGNKIYDIGTAPTNIIYDKIMNTQTVTHNRYGITDRYDGIYYGGVVPLGTNLPAHTEGSNAGSITIGARQAVLDGIIDGTVEKGIYQYMTANPTTNDSQTKSGYVEPLGGELYMGNTASNIQDNDTLDRYFGDIVVSGQIGPILSSGFTSTSDLSQVLGSGKTILSSVALNNAGLSKIYLAANKTVTIANDARITLVPGKQEEAGKTSTFEVMARRIEHYGTVTVPGGDIKLSIEGNKTSDPAGENYVLLNERVYLADGSALDVKGERIDNRIVASAGAIRFGAHTQGGTVTIKDTSVSSDVSLQEGVVVSKGALIDVSGGWLISTAGKVSGGDAGSVELQGYSLFIDGDLRGYSLTGNKGGTISMAAGNVSVGADSATLPDGFTADSPWPDSARGRLVLGAGRFTNTGFTNLALKSLTDVTVDGGVRLTPSLAKLAITGTIATAIRDDIGASSFNLTANAGFSDLAIGSRYNASDSPLKSDHLTAFLRISPEAAIEAAPGGSVSLGGPLVDIYGMISAPSGIIDISSATGNIILHSSAKVLAEGYNKRTAAPLKNLPVEYAPLSAGTVTLNAANGILNIESGSLVSVAGSSPVLRTLIEKDGTISSYMDASKAGSIVLTALDMTLAGVLKGQTGIAGRQGGSLAITKKGTSIPFYVSAADLARYRDSGFDALTLASNGELNLSGPMDIAFGRSITLNARTITGSGSISLTAPWMQVMYNPTSVNTSGPNPSPGDATLRLVGTSFLDVTGDVVFSGFSNIYLQAGRDMRFADLIYDATWKGLLRTAGDLTLVAARIYPTTGSVFTIETTGKTTILPSGGSTAGSIYSAAGSLGIKAAGGIEHRGYIAAPMGTISLEATGTGLGGRVYLAADSVVTTQGDIAVKYGRLDSTTNYSWIMTDKSGTTSPVESTPEKSVSLKGEDVIVRQGAAVDISGGGEIFTYQFTPSTSGTNNPLQKTSNGKSVRWVIVPDNSIILPGSAVYLSGGNGLKAGVYSLLPEEYAFLPGAMIITDLNMGLSGAKPTLTKEGYSIVAGYETVMGTNIQSGSMKAYSLRSASDVLAEGTFVVKSITAGDGGALKVTASNTAIIDGTVRATALPGFKTGAFYVGGDRVVLQSFVPPLPDGFGFSKDIPTDLAGTANISQSLLNGEVFGTIGLGYDPAAAGDHITATEVTLKEGTTLEAETIILGARQVIILEKGAQVLAIASGGRRGEATFTTGNNPDKTRPFGIIIKENAAVHVSDAINLDTANLNLDPSATFMSDHSELNLTGPRIVFVQDDYTQSASDVGLFLTAKQFERFGSAFENIGLKSKSDLLFNGDVALTVSDTLTIDAGSVRGGATIDIEGKVHDTVELTARTINILNTGATPNIPPGSQETTGTITFTAAIPEGPKDAPGGNIYVGKGTVLFDNFDKVNLNAQNDLVFKGVGKVNTGNADLNITASRVTTSYYMDSGTYTATDFAIDAGIGKVNVSKSTITGGKPGNDSAPGNLEIKADSIDVATLVETPAGRLKLTAAGDISLNAGAGLRAVGTDYAPGGDIILTSTDGGKIEIKETRDASGNVIASIDVSAGGQGDAGSITLYAPAGGVNLEGKIQGGASTGSDERSGLGGSFYMTTNQLNILNNVNAFTALNRKVRDGGFTENLDIRVRTGDITIAGTDDNGVKARNVKITADGGDLTLRGTIDASQVTGDAGTVELNAWNNLTIDSPGNIDAGSTGGKGGEISLNAGHVGAWSTGTLQTGTGTGTLTVNAGSQTNVEGSASGEGGMVHFRAYRNDVLSNPSNMDLQGTITGASEITAETAKAYRLAGTSDNLSGYSIAYNVGPATVDWANLTVLPGTQGSGATPKTLSGIEIQREGNLVVDNDITLSSVRPGGQAGALTLRAAGNLNINANIIDNPTNNNGTLLSTNMRDSWGINLVAGADMASADHVAVKPVLTMDAAGGRTTGNLTIGSTSLQKVVYTEKGPIRFASGGDTTINEGPANNFMIKSMQYAIGSYGGSISGNVEGNLNIMGGVIQSAISDIDITTGGNLMLGKGRSNTYLGTIRTTGEHVAGRRTIDYNTYHGGGSIDLHVGGNVAGELSRYWLTTMTVSPSIYVIPLYGDSANRTTEGIVALAGGSVYARAGGNFSAQTGAFGTGDLRVYSGGDLQGRFLIKKGTGELSAGGNFGALNKTQLIEMSDAQVVVAAQGNLEIGAILNPNLARYGSETWWDNGYTVKSSVKLTAVTGDVNMDGQVDPNRYDTGTDGNRYHYTESERTRYLPATVEIEAGRDINVRGEFVLLPAKTGQLRMTALNDIAFTDGKITMSDADDSGNPYTVYGTAWKAVVANPLPRVITDHGSVKDDSGNDAPLHYGDEKASINAGRDISNMSIVLPKKASINAGRDIVSLSYDGMNISDADVTMIIAGRDIVYGYGCVTTDASQKGIIDVGGPGYVIVQGGGTIDLGNTKGITARGNMDRQYLTSRGSSLLVAAGMERELGGEETAKFFDSLRSAGDEYSVLLAAGDNIGAQQKVDEVRATIINPFIASVDGAGDILMTSSQISTWAGGDLLMLAGGKIDVGKSAIGSGKTQTSTTQGIFTAMGGSIDIFTQGDVNVNEARIMTFMGGDITIWSDLGNINAGRGSRTAISATPPYSYVDTKTGKIITVFQPPTVGSGIRALTYDPDGAGQRTAPEAGILHIFAPKGIIDAGEAGMGGRSAFIGGVQVVNTQNMSFGQGAVGMPAQAQSVNLGSLGGTGLATKETMSTGMETLSNKVDSNSADATKPIMEMLQRLEVKVISYELRLDEE